MKFDNRQLAALPKVLLHEHLDGVLRPQTVIDLAKETKYAELPTSDPTALASMVSSGRQQGEPGQISGRLRPHHRRDADGRGAGAGCL